MGMSIDSHFTVSERRGLLLFAIILMLIVGAVWLFSGGLRKPADEVIQELRPTQAEVVTDSLRTNAPRKSRKATRKKPAPKPIEPRRSPLDEPIPPTR